MMNSLYRLLDSANCLNLIAWMTINWTNTERNKINKGN